MARYTYDRLSAQDNSFLLAETPNLHMHVSSILIFEAGPLETEDGGIDVSTIKRATEGYLHLVPRYRQKLHWIPLMSHAVWVDDRHFSLDYHIRHTALPRPGTDEQLKELAARIMQQPLDKRRPLWENWVVEGLEGNRFALITKIHHCMIDGSSGVDLAQIQMKPEPTTKISQAPRFIPRPAPSNSELLRDELARTASTPFEILRGVRNFAAEAEDLREEIAGRARILRQLLGEASSASETPLNGIVGPHRSFDWLRMSLDDVKAVRRGLECSVNDVVLTIVTGAVREYMIRRSVAPDRLEFRVSTPVSVRSEAERGQMGNRVSSWIIPLPIGEEDPAKQLDAIRSITQEFKENNQALGVEMMMKVAEWTPSILLSLGSQSISGPINTIVTNVPGPQFPLYFHGARLIALYPQVPLLPTLGIGIALMSYDGRLCWGLNGDPDIVPDLDVFGELIDASFRRLAAAAGVELDADAVKTQAPRKAKQPKKKAASAAASRSETETVPVSAAPPDSPTAH